MKYYNIPKKDNEETIYKLSLLVNILGVSILLPSRFHKRYPRYNFFSDKYRFIKSSLLKIVDRFYIHYFSNKKNIIILSVHIYYK